MIDAISPTRWTKSIEEPPNHDHFRRETFECPFMTFHSMIDFLKNFGTTFRAFLPALARKSICIHYPIEYLKKPSPALQSVQLVDLALFRVTTVLHINWVSTKKIGVD